MIIRNIRHKGLRRLVEDDDASGLNAAIVPKLRKIILFLIGMADEDELRSFPLWKPHQMTGDRKGVWALHVTGNWRVTFTIDQGRIEIIDLDFEDYH